MWRYVAGTIAMAVALAAVGTGAQALGERASRTSETDDLARAAAMSGLTEAQVRALRDRGIAWQIIRQAGDVVAAEGVTPNEAVERIIDEMVERSLASDLDEGQEGQDRRNRREADPAERIAAAAGIPERDIRAFQIRTGLDWDTVRRVARFAAREGLSLDQAYAEYGDRVSG